MRKIAIALLLALVAFVACAQTVYYKNQATLMWNPVTTDSAGNPLLPGDLVSYEVYIYNYVVGVADPQNISQLLFIGAPTGTELLIVFPYRTTWAAGVRTKLIDSGGTIVFSPIAWSYIVADADVVAGPFLYSPYGLPKKPKDLRDKGI